MNTMGCVLLMVWASGVPPQDRWLPITVEPGARHSSGVSRRTEITLRFDSPVPEIMEVVRLVREGRGWRLADVSRRPVNPLTRELSTAGPPGDESLLVLRSPGRGGYILDGPFRWPDQPALYFIAARWRRTIRGGWPRAGSPPPRWIAGRLDAPGDGWPQCRWIGDSEWECIGIPLLEPGVVISAARGHIAFAAGHARFDPGAVQQARSEATVWGRLVTVRGASPGGDQPALRASAWRVEPTRSGPNGEPGELVRDARVRIDVLGESSFWITGDQKPDNSWIELARPGWAPARVSVEDLWGAPPESPLHLSLDTARAVFGRVSTPDRQPVRGVLVALFRIVDPRPGSVTPPVLVLAGEQSTQDDGGFRFADLSMETYELAVMDPSVGRLARRLEPDGQPVEIVLDRERQRACTDCHGDEGVASRTAGCAPSSAARRERTTRRSTESSPVCVGPAR